MVLILIRALWFRVHALICFSGHLSSTVYSSYSFYRSKHQANDDPRPYLHSVLAAGLIGNAPQIFDTMKAALSLKKEVGTIGTTTPNLNKTQRDSPLLWRALLHLYLPFQTFDFMIHGQSKKHGFYDAVGLQRPASRGTIRLASGNPFHHPLINPNYLEQDVDVEHLLYGQCTTCPEQGPRGVSEKC